MSKSQTESKTHDYFFPANNTNPGVNPHHFLGGGMCREEATSAFLATLIEQSGEFRSRFFKHCGILDFEVKGVEVERRCRDVTILGDGIAVVIENKISAAAKTEGQLIRYYNQIKEELDSGATVHSVYLSPKKNIGQSEVSKIPKVPGEIATSIAWGDLKTLATGLTDFDKTFAEVGIDTVLLAIKNRKVKSTREFSEEEELASSALLEAASLIQNSFPKQQIVKFGLGIWSYGTITFHAETKGITQVESSLEQKVDFRFKVRNKAHRGEEAIWRAAKEWFSKIETAGEWRNFKLDSEKSVWCESSETFFGGVEQIATQLAKAYTQMLKEIESEITVANN
jgi:hypothetical protein